MQFHEVGIRSIHLNEKSLNLVNIEFEMDAVSDNEMNSVREFTNESGLNRNCNINELSDEISNLSKNDANDVDDKNTDRLDGTDTNIKSDQDVSKTILFDKNIEIDHCSESNQSKTISLLESTNNKENKLKLMNGLCPSEELNLNSELNVELSKQKFNENNHDADDDGYLDKKSSLKSDYGNISIDSKVDISNNDLNKSIAGSIATCNEEHNLQINKSTSTLFEKSILPNLKCVVSAEDINIESNIQSDRNSIESEERLQHDTTISLRDNPKIKSMIDVEEKTLKFPESEKNSVVNLAEFSKKISDSQTVVEDEISVESSSEKSKLETETENKNCNTAQTERKYKTLTTYLESEESESYNGVDNNIAVSPEDVYKIIGVNDTGSVVESVSSIVSTYGDDIREQSEIASKTLSLSESIKTINDVDNKMEIDLMQSDIEIDITKDELDKNIEENKIKKVFFNNLSDESDEQSQDHEMIEGAKQLKPHETIKNDEEKHNDFKVCTDIEMKIMPDENVVDCLVLDEKQNDSSSKNDLKSDVINDINLAKIENETSASSLNKIGNEIVHKETNIIVRNKLNPHLVDSCLSVGSISTLVTSDEISTSESKVSSYAKIEDGYDNKAKECINNDSEKCSPSHQTKNTEADEIVDLDVNSSDSLTLASKINPVASQVEKIIENCESKTTEVLDISSYTKPITDSTSEKSEDTTNIDSCNTLNIISDDEDDSLEKQNSTEVLLKNKKPCVTIDDDDDVMVIDEIEKDSVSKKTEVENIETKESDIAKPVVEKRNSISNVDDSIITDMDKVITENHSPIFNQDIDNEVKVEESSSKLKSDLTDDKPSTVNEINKTETEKKDLFSSNFIKTFKKSLGKMTRDDLEEFCLVKIVEAIAERSNLSELKTQVKVISENVDEWRKKYMLLSKQNRDLEIVLRTVTDEHKKRTTELVTPLKVTRSVGLQVHSIFNQNKNLAEHSLARNRLAKLNKTATKPNVSNNRNSYRGNINKQNTTPILPQKPPIHNIPVPRLVPLPSNPTPPKPLSTGSPTMNGSLSGLLGKALSGPNGVKKVPPVKQPEKRTFSQSQSQAIDLTDDEPPSKLLNMNSKSPIRGTTPHANSNITRPTMFVNGATGPVPQRQVYIPISSQQSQGNVRPGQTIMFKAHGGMANNPRFRQITPVRQSLSSGQVPLGNIRGSVKIPTMTSHPAPLPQAAKQPYHNSWKLLPPSPELKISKVDNGIVISWIMEGYVEARFEEIASYQIYAYQETTSPPSTALWKKIGDVKALPLPMACTLTQFMAGYKYYFAVRAVDVKSRVGPFSLPGSILLLNKK